MSARYTAEQFELRARALDALECPTCPWDTDKMLRQAASDLAEREQLIVWLKGEKDAATSIINSGGPEQAVLVATGLHAAYRATLAKFTEAEREAAQGRTCETCQFAGPSHSAWVGNDCRYCTFIKDWVPLVANGQLFSCAGWAAREAP